MRFKDAIEEIMGITKKKVSYTDIANALEVTRQYAHQIRDKAVSVDQLQRLEKYFGVELADAKRAVEKNEDDCVTLERIHINPSCGLGTYVCGRAEITPVRLGISLITDVLKGSSPKNLKIFYASGDSMSPTIEDGDLLLVDVGKKDFRNGGIFLLTINNEWFIKRLRLKITGELEIISENEAKYGAPEIVRENDNIEIVIKGRVIKNLSRGL